MDCLAESLSPSPQPPSSRTSTAELTHTHTPNTTLCVPPNYKLNCKNQDQLPEHQLVGFVCAYLVQVRFSGRFVSERTRREWRDTHHMRSQTKWERTAIVLVVTINAACLPAQTSPNTLWRRWQISCLWISEHATERENSCRLRHSEAAVRSASHTSFAGAGRGPKLWSKASVSCCQVACGWRLWTKAQLSPL